MCSSDLRDGNEQEGEHPLLDTVLRMSVRKLTMIFVVVEELVPEAHRGGNGDIATMGVMLGFSVMMVLDVGMG